MDDYTSLICEIKSGSRTAFNTLYRIHYPGLLAYAELFLDEGGAEDVVQDVFLNVWINRDNLNDSSSLKGYLLRSVYNTSLNYLKKEKYARKYSSEYQQQIEELGYLFMIRNPMKPSRNCIPKTCIRRFRLLSMHCLPSAGRYSH